MNAIANIVGQQTMGSREIAELVGARHDKVKQSIERLAARGVIGLPPMGEYLDTLGRPAKEYRVGKRDSYVIVAQLSPEFTARLVDRWQELEAQVAASVNLALLSPEARSAIGGIVKAVVHKEIDAIIPARVQAELVAHRFHVVEGVSALEIAEIAGYAKGNRPRGLIQCITRRVGRYHEDRGVPINRSPHGSGKVRLFNEATARKWLAEGGKAEIAAYVAERRGQGRLRLVEPPTPEEPRR